MCVVWRKSLKTAQRVLKTSVSDSATMNLFLLRVAMLVELLPALSDAFAQNSAGGEAQGHTHLESSSPLRAEEDSHISEEYDSILSVSYNQESDESIHIISPITNPYFHPVINTPITSGSDLTVSAEHVKFSQPSELFISPGSPPTLPALLSGPRPPIIPGSDATIPSESPQSILIGSHSVTSPGLSSSQGSLPQPSTFQERPPATPNSPIPPVPMESHFPLQPGTRIPILSQINSTLLPEQGQAPDPDYTSHPIPESHPPIISETLPPMSPESRPTILSGSSPVPPIPLSRPPISGFSMIPEPWPPVGQQPRPSIIPGASRPVFSGSPLPMASGLCSGKHLGLNPSMCSGAISPISWGLYSSVSPATLPPISPGFRPPMSPGPILPIFPGPRPPVLSGSLPQVLSPTYPGYPLLPKYPESRPPVPSGSLPPTFSEIYYTKPPQSDKSSSSKQDFSTVSSTEVTTESQSSESYWSLFEDSGEMASSSSSEETYEEEYETEGKSDNGEQEREKGQSTVSPTEVTTESQSSESYSSLSEDSGEMASSSSSEETDEEEYETEDNSDNGEQEKEKEQQPSALPQHEGYLLETHHVATSDGYVLAMHRLRPAPSRQAAAAVRDVALLWHGLLGSSADWFLGGPSHALAYLLADNSIDVWMGNTRGNTFSRNHTRLEVTDSNFWNFSLHEVAVFDLPAAVDLVLEATGMPRLHVVVHSTGAAVLLAMLAELPEYNAKLNVAFVLAPAAFLQRASSPLLRLLAAATQTLREKTTTNLIGRDEFYLVSSFLEGLKKVKCQNVAPDACICANLVFRLLGCDSAGLHPEISEINKYTPSGTSSKLLTHVGQLIASGKFQKFDYGPINNAHHYGLPDPQEYEVGKAYVRIVLFYADNDLVVNITDLEQLSRRLPCVVQAFRVARPDFNHLDFVWASDARPLVYQRLMHLLIGLST